MQCINFESILVNILIELREMNIFKISIKQFIDYLFSVVHQYEKICNKKIYIYFNQSDIEYFVNINSNVLGMYEDNQKQKYIYLRGQININELKEQFRWTLSYEMLKAINKINIKKVLNLYNNINC